MTGQNRILNGHIGTVSDIEKSTIGGAMISFPNDAMFQSIRKNMGTSDSNTPGIVGISRLRTIGDSCKMTTGDSQQGFVNGKSCDLCDLIKVPDDGSIHIDIPIFIDYKYISL